MIIMTHFFNRPSGDGAQPYCFSNPRGEYETMDKALAISKSIADVAQMKAHSFRIECGETKVDELWTKNGDNWEMTSDKNSKTPA
jgi:hypothetical protein